MSNQSLPWGADGQDVANNAPNWNYIDNEFRGSQNTVVADTQGWAIQHGWGDEVVVAIGGLVTTLGVVSFRDISGAITNAAAQVLKVAVQTNYGLNLGAANLANVWVVAISDDANVANVNLIYSAADSTPESGELVFKSASTDLSLATPNVTTFTVNSTSALHGNAQVLPRKPTTNPQSANAAPFGVANAVVIAVA